MNVYELIASVIALLGVFLTSRGHIAGWIFGVIASATYIPLFFSNELYAESALQLVYVVMGIYGFYAWKQLGKNKDERPILNIKKYQFIFLLSIYLLMTYLLGLLLNKYTDTDVPFADASMGAGGLLITWMMAQKYIEHWICWIVIDIANAGLFVYKELYITAFVYVIFAIMAVYGFFVWKKQQQTICIN
jgi:nicotinamide mononucleotide transporter